MATPGVVVLWWDVRYRTAGRRKAAAIQEQSRSECSIKLRKRDGEGMSAMRSSPDRKSAEEPADKRLASMILRTFAPPAEASTLAEHTRQEIAETAHEWQEIGTWADWLELHGSSLGVPPDTLHELAGCVAAAGEQLGLAWTSEQDTQRWQTVSSDGKPMAIRALADIRAYFSLGAAHGMGNATLRTLFLAGEATDAITRAPGNFRPYPPFSGDRKAWPTFNANLVRALEAGAAATNEARVIDHVAILRMLVDDPRYTALVERRGMDFHRWRPQGLPGGSGVPQASLWKKSDGARSLSFGGGFPPDALADPDLVSAIATNGMVAIAETMKLWLDRWPDAMAALGVKVWKTSEGDDA